MSPPYTLHFAPDNASLVIRIALDYIGAPFRTAHVDRAANRHGGLLPAPAGPGRGDALKWLFFLSSSLHAGLRQMFYPHKFVDAAHSAALRAGLAGNIRRDFAQIDALIAAEDCFGTGNCMALDIYAVCLFRFARLYPRDMPEGWVRPADYPALLTLCARLDALPAVGHARTAEGLGPAPFSAPVHANPPIGSAT